MAPPAAGRAPAMQFWPLPRFRRKPTLIFHNTSQDCTILLLEDRFNFRAHFRRRCFSRPKGPDRCPRLRQRFSGPSSLPRSCWPPSWQRRNGRRRCSPTIRRWGRRGSISSGSKSTPPGNSSPGGWLMAPRRPASLPAPGRWPRSAASWPASLRQGEPPGGPATVEHPPPPMARPAGRVRPTCTRRGSSPARASCSGCATAATSATTAPSTCWPWRPRVPARASAWWSRP